MAGHTTHQPHGSGIRGLSSLKNIDNEHELAGKFGRMFKGPDFPPTNFQEEDLFKLGDAMTSTDGPKDGEVFLALLEKDHDSIVHHPEWKPMQGSTTSFGLADILKAALAG